jgi:hypothetical protein
VASGPYEVTDFVDKNLDCSLIPELGSGQDVTKARVDQEEEKLCAKRLPRRTPKKKTNAPAPVDDKDYFDKEYKSTILSYWTASYDEHDVLAYLNDGDASQKRGSSYRKFVRTLYDLGNEYLSPEEFMKLDGKLYK